MNSVCLPASPDYVCAARKAMLPKGGAAIAAARNGTAEVVSSGGWGWGETDFEKKCGG